MLENLLLTYQWIILILFGIGFYFLAPISNTVKEFFSATNESGSQTGTFVLTGSLVISWIFAKSITNAANLGQEFGIVGGLAYSFYYLSFLTAGFIIYQLRVTGGFKSIHDFLHSRYGSKAVALFSVLIAFRLFNEVWSNTIIIGSYFGENGSTAYYIAILVFTILTLGYTLKGGLRSSLLTDAIQMVLFGLVLVILLGVILPSSEKPIQDYISSSTWSFANGLNLLFVVLIQVFSYPFHDSVMTDRGFISSPKTTLKSFILASIIGVICILAFSLIGVFAKLQGIIGSPTFQVGTLFGTGILLAMNLIMVTSAASTLDSAFSSFSKLAVIDLNSKSYDLVKTGRIMMILMAIIGTIPVFLNPAILSATTISGTMVIGLAPIFLFWKLKAPKLSYYLSISIGIAFGVLLTTNLYPSSWVFTDGKYADLLSSNVFGSLACFGGFLIPILFQRKDSI